jgi:hypothetical protein
VSAACKTEKHCHGSISDAEAYFRMRAARLSRDFPEVLAMLSRGEIHLSALKVLAPAMTPENSAELLAASRFATKSAVQALVNFYAPKPDVKNEIRKLPGKPRVQETPPQQQPLREPASSSTTQAHQPPLLASHAPEKAPQPDVPSPALSEHRLTPSSASPRTPAPSVMPPLQGAVHGRSATP